MDPHNPPEFGDKVAALVEIDRLHLFDAETEQRMPIECAGERRRLMERLRRVAAVALTALVAAPATAPPKLVVWHAYRAEEKAALEKVAAALTRRIQHAREHLAVPYDAFADKISAAVPRGKGPDVFIYAQDRLALDRSGNTVEPIDFFIARTPRTGSSRPRWRR